MANGEARLAESLTGVREAAPAPLAEKEASMAGRKPRTPAPAAAPMSAGGSDDEVPEEFSQASAARQAQEQRARERQAREAARSASKRCDWRDCCGF